MLSMRGIYTIPLTPFKDNLDVDYDDYRRSLDFSLACGSHGIVAPVNASEFSTLSKDERDKIVEITFQVVNGKVPVVIGCTGKTIDESKYCINFAQDKGADAIVVMPPVESRLTTENELYEFYGKMNELAKVPIFLQDFGAPDGTPMTAEFMMKMVRDFNNIYMIKEETEFSPIVMSQLHEMSKGLSKEIFGGYMGGKGCRYLLFEYSRGACGNMPSCHIADVLVDIWNLLETGCYKLACDLYEKAVPMFLFEVIHQLASYKEILCRRGIIKTPKCRAKWHSAPIDRKASEELDGIIDRLRPYFRVKSI